MIPKTLVVAGAGVVGLAIARTAACRGLQVFVLEKNAFVGQETSARNSEVVHAGIYYTKESWKARLCIKGREQLYAFCDEYNVPYLKCGKLIVAHSHQLKQLRAILKRGLANGVTDLKLLTQTEARAIEPFVNCDEAIFSPSTGIVDSYGFMMVLQSEAENYGAVVVPRTKVQSGLFNSKSKTFLIQAVQGGDNDIQEVECDYFVNAIGMFAPTLLDKVVVSDREIFKFKKPTLPDLFAKGTYLKLRETNRPFTHLIYPIPEVGGLGVHATIDLTGNVRFGPDVEWINEIEYRPNPLKADKFADRIRDYWPDIHADMLNADYCGIRPKIAIDGKILEDFYIADKYTHRIPGLVHLCGIESPGLTASLAIADTVVNMLQDSDVNSPSIHYQL
ncbi:fad-dependent oxidoreductase [Plasmopara halstedii]|uniref:L-2-hydroxyglutarate dehydrogenase, mitochondrial n=1 Tax=Plasmopara halstedii TaxID=4781 RepID=A0A0P1A6X9_PLAHL|nr:fad-dependent oxidoreductase [Plasmopara halstedii]CEG35927.1 fad-dependent oxidoreductase [Plasmopara halstedii]|eukprot:XP_024572296.1 fad-dependent oxidoreductase [Plasmopara halstedii]